MAKNKAGRGRGQVHLTRELFDRIIETPVGEAGCPIVITPTSAEDARRTRIVRNAIHLLDALHEQPQNLTQKTRQLNRRFVRMMLEALELDDDFVEIRRGWRTLDEEQVWPLAMLRDLVQVARLARVYRGRLLITRRGDALRAPGREGELHHALLMTYLSRYNIAATDRYREDPVMDALLGPALFRLGTLLREPQPLAEFADRLPHDADIWDAPLSLLEFGIDPAWELHGALTRRVLEPLADFGLLASMAGKPGGDERTTRLREDSARRWQVTPLFDRIVALDTGKKRVCLGDVVVPLPAGAKELVPESERMSVRESLDAFARQVAPGDPDIAAGVRQRLAIVEVVSGVPFLTAPIGSRTPIEAAIDQIPRLMRTAKELSERDSAHADQCAVLAVIFAGYVTWCVTHGQARHEVGARALAALDPWLPEGLADECQLN